MQTLHRFEVRVNRGAEGKSAKVFVGQLSEENALELAGKVISESFLWLVGRLSAHLPEAVSAPEAFNLPLEHPDKDKAVLAICFYHFRTLCAKISYALYSALQTASGVIFWEYERQRGKDLARAAKEKAFQEANDEDKRVSCLQHSAHFLLSGPLACPALQIQVVQGHRSLVDDRVQEYHPAQPKKMSRSR